MQQDIHIHLGIELHLICPRCESLTEGLFLCFPWYRLLDSWTENENAMVNAMCYRQWAYVCFCIHLCSCMLSQHCICNCILCSCCFTVVGFPLHKFLYIYTYILFIIHTILYWAFYALYFLPIYPWVLFLSFFLYVVIQGLHMILTCAVAAAFPYLFLYVYFFMPHCCHYRMWLCTWLFA